MIDLNQEQLLHLREIFAKFNLESALPKLAALLTIPPLQANAIRIETAIHYAVACSQGNHLVRHEEIERVLNTEFAGISHTEDPADDVFIANVITPEGNRRLFQGVWDANDYYAQKIIYVLLSYEIPQECQELLESVFALLRVSEEIARRMDLPRWHQETSTAQGDIRLPGAAVLRKATGAVSFTEGELSELSIDINALSPFVLSEADKPSLLNQTIGNTLLERYPLVRIEENLICALPNSMSPAVRRYVVEELGRKGQLRAFSHALAEYEFEQVREKLNREFPDFAPLRNIPEAEGKCPSLHSWVINYDLDKLLHVIVIHGRLDGIKNHGFKWHPTDDSAERFRGLERYIATVATWCKSQPDCREGTTLLVLGGLGEPFIGGTNETFEGWQISALSGRDFHMLTSEDDRPITRYLKFLKQRAWAEKRGVEFFCLEDFALYCRWCQADYMLVPQELHLQPGSAFVALDVCAGAVREQRAGVRSLVDRHALPTIYAGPGRFARVRRFHASSIFASQRQKPIYADPDSTLANLLAGAVETKHGVSWFTASTKRGQPIRELPYPLWEGFIDLFERLVAELEKRGLNQDCGVVEVRLDCSDVEPFDEQAPREPIPTPFEPNVARSPGSRLATVKLPENFLHFFRQPENTGERLLVRSITRALLQLQGTTAEDSEDKIVESLTESVAGDSGVRVIHAYQSHDSIEILRQKTKIHGLRFIPQEDYHFLYLGLCDNVTPRPEHDRLESRTDCKNFLNAIAESLFKRLRTALKALDRTSVLLEMLERKEAITADRHHWRRTARAILALHSELQDGAITGSEREARRATTGLAARSIMEMAICECPSKGGRQLSSWEADELLATMLCMIDTAARSDAIYHGLAKPKIELFANGEYGIDLSFQDEVLNPFLTAYTRGQIFEAADDYENLYSDDSQGSSEGSSNAIPNELVAAFRAEFRLTPEQISRGVGELIELAYLKKNLVVETTVGEIKSRLMENCQYSPEECEHFVCSFGLIHRSNWRVPPEGYKNTDISPWRYGRRLSVVVKPLLLFGRRNEDKVFYSASMLKDGLKYLVGKISDGRLSKDSVASEKMRRYIGSINNKLGRDFEKEVAAQFEGNHWNVRRRLRLSVLGAPAELGDIDVLAWKADGQVLVIECKHLQFARTVAEIANVCKRFRGEARDELDKHLQRFKWIKENASSLKQVVSFQPKVSQLDDRIVTSVPVPLSYLTALPIEPKKFVSLNQPGLIHPP